MNNPFLALAERQTPAPVKARLRASEARRSKRDDERQQLSAHYRWHREQELARILAGPSGAKLTALIERLDALTLDSIPELTAFVLAADWHAADADACALAHRLTSETIIKLRERRGLTTFDDPLPGDPATPEWVLHCVFADHPGRETPDQQASKSYVKAKIKN